MTAICTSQMEWRPAWKDQSLCVTCTLLSSRMQDLYMVLSSQRCLSTEFIASNAHSRGADGWDVNVHTYCTVRFIYPSYLWLTPGGLLCWASYFGWGGVGWMECQRLEVVMQYMWRRFLGPCMPNELLAELSKVAM